MLKELIKKAINAEEEEFKRIHAEFIESAKDEKEFESLVEFFAGLLRNNKDWHLLKNTVKVNAYLRAR